MAEKLQNRNELGSVRPVRNLNEKLASVLLDSSAKDDLLIKQEKLMQEDIAGQEEAKVACLRKDLDEDLKQGVAANEKLPNSDAALKACMQQLSSLQEEQEQKIQDAVMKAKSDFDKEKKKLEDKLREMNKKVASLAVENTNFSKALVLKDKLVEELHIRSSQTAAEFDALMARLDTTEKENALLKYEFHMLEKELEVRNEELEYTRRSADVSHRKHLESVKKISNLESECQRLRVLMRKKLPGPATLARMKNEVETLGRNPIELRKPNPTRDLVLRDTIGEKSSEIPVKNINFLIEQLRGMEEENRTLKEILTKKNTELRSSRIRYSQTASKLTQVETKLIELSGGQKHVDLAKCSPVSSELYPLAGFDFGSDDGLSSSGSWANALMSELEHFKDAKLKGPSDCRAIEVSNISLMDDFVEMEKLALVSAQTPSAGTSHSLSTGKELVPVVQGQSGCNEKQEVHSRHVSADKSFDWIQEVLNAIFKEQRISKRSLTELLEDIKIALGYINHPSVFQVDTTAMSKHLESDNRSCLTCKSSYISSIIHSLNEASTAEASAKETMKQCSLLNLGKSIGKIIQLIEGINPTPLLCNGATDNMSKREESSLFSAVSADYSVHVFQWRSSELSSILKRFILACNSLLNGKASTEFFAEELLFTLDWIVTSCVTPKDASSARDKIKRHFSQSESQRDSEVGVEVDFRLMDSNAICSFKEKPPCFPSAASFNEQNSLFQIKSGWCDLQEEIRRLKDKLKNMESGKEEMEIKLQRATDKNETLMMQLQKSEQSMKSLLLELESMRESKGMIEDQMENQKLINEDLDTQLTVAKAKLNEVLQKFTSLEVELEEKNNCCEELEATCLELQLQLESVAKKESSNYTTSEDRTQNQNGSDITAASLKLAECQETILNLGKQLKALATPTEAALFDKVFNANGSTTTAAINKSWNRRFSLRDQMLAEDTSKPVILRSPTADAKDNSNNSNSMSAPSFLAPSAEAKFDSRQKSGTNAIGALAIVPGKKQGIGFFRRLLMRRKKDSIKKSHSLVKV
ncbi:filament-like plant protein 7 isoform X3 [Manihot esculenta]|uniref:Uncharacterized protein n=3 Tax=Manihot esculenta TaxID=3983 RepID=A0ACB7HFA8_MANES|nr:filament-like plant protein 7 isoform X3 [Manihot esculenta]KAG8650839.1 hypothetical protein MANES_07G077000v8 [Manihot esculenta]KAG8650840.1 hypothetical protein MANES_07G077000v8 [Manihot esculenta]KAG8650841.1 hypothetical protein MANES_07G077000v8 [Manihot esculenta]